MSRKTNEQARCRDGKFAAQEHARADRGLASVAVDVPVHRYATTSEAFSAALSDSSVRDGDVLVTEDGVAGFMYGKLPIAVTPEAGSFFRIDSKDTFLEDTPEYAQSWATAEKETA